MTNTEGVFYHPLQKNGSSIDFDEPFFFIVALIAFLNRIF
jgi:hypothetical protein